MNPKSEFKNLQNGNFHRLLDVATATALLCLAAAHSPAQTYTVLHAFAGGSEGAYPQASTLVLSGTTLYGTTSSGGTAGYGTVFKLNADGSGYVVLHSFTNTDGSDPQASLVLSEGTLYGTTTHTSGDTGGTIFKVNVDGSGFTVLKRYTDGNDGAAPIGSLVLSGTNIYGTTAYASLYRGGASGDGMVFKLNTDGSGYTVLKSFSGTDGRSPSGLLLSGATLYGTTVSGGAAGDVGTVFKLNTDGSGFTVLKSFSLSEGARPNAGLALSGATLYGTTMLGGSNVFGTVFKINTNGNGFAVLKNFTGSDGESPQAGVIVSGAMLYGTTFYGGSGYSAGFPGWSGGGAVFGLNTNGSDYIVLTDFNSTNSAKGLRPYGGLVAAGTTLYGTTSSGGSFNCGVVFSLSIARPIILSSPPNQTVEAGSTVRLGLNLDRSLPLTLQWFFNGTNAMCDPTTNACLELTNVRPCDCGVYTVVITNLFGAVTNASLVLNVIPPVERRPVPALDLLGETGSALNVEYADALASPANWLPLDTVSLTSPPQYFFDLTVPLPPQRFYRVWQMGTPAAPPSLNLPFLVPAITLTGNIGDQLRLDCINQFGPTDAWVNLATVTLTNTSQLYFDLSAPGQPRRLYRIVPVP